MTQAHTTYRIAINDANLFIDLFEIELIDSFFLLNLEFHTTSLILSELEPNQQTYIQKFVEIGKLKIREVSITEIETFKDLPVQTQKLSVNDLSLYFYALELEECVILTGDNRLRKEAEKIGFEVHGVLWVFEEMVNHNILEKQIAVQKLQELMKVNLWLPNNECNLFLDKFIKFC